jgi:hypothetical protein
MPSGPRPARSLSARLAVELSQRAFEIGEQFRKRHGEGGAPADHDVITPALRRNCRCPHHFSQASPDPVALDRRTNFPGNRETEAGRALISTIARLKQERLGRSLFPPGSSNELRASPQPLEWPRRRPGQALSLLRPRARRAASTRRPPFVAMRARKPWRRLRTSLLG